MKYTYTGVVDKAPLLSPFKGWVRTWGSLPVYIDRGLTGKVGERSFRNG